MTFSFLDIDAKKPNLNEDTVSLADFLPIVLSILIASHCVPDSKGDKHELRLQLAIELCPGRSH